ncbi:hypothetical protein L1887_14854 [Cichorium endivia]|nr:hypothetical protein L1887_14854 [Cichorium endivia]
MKFHIDLERKRRYIWQVFSQYGQSVHVKILLGKRCGFVQFAARQKLRGGSFTDATRNSIWWTNCEDFYGAVVLQMVDTMDTDKELDLVDKL